MSAVPNVGVTRFSASRYFEDELGSSRIITNATGVPCYDADLYPFGAEQYVYTNTCPQNYKFTGKERDAETGLDEFGARYYSSALGRFTIPDWAAKPTAIPYAKFGDPQTLNLYSYVENSPVNRADADGHGWWMNLKQRLKNLKDGLGWRTDQQVVDAAAAARAELKNKGIISSDGNATLYTADKLRQMSDKDVLQAQEQFNSAKPLSDATPAQLASLVKVEVHHELPQQFEEFFRSRGLDIEDYTREMGVGPHRLKSENGLHARGSDGWNQEWGRWIKNNPSATKNQILQHLDQMRKDFGVE